VEATPQAADLILRAFWHGAASVAIGMIIGITIAFMMVLLGII